MRTTDVLLWRSMELAINSSEAKTPNDTPIEAPRKKRGRPRKVYNFEDALVQAKMESLKDINGSFLSDKNPNEKLLLYEKMLTEPKKRGRPKKNKSEFPKTKLMEVNVPTFNKLFLPDTLLEQEYSPFESSNIISAEGPSPARRWKAVPDIVPTENVDPVQLGISVEDGSDNCASIRIRRCSVRLNRLPEDIRQKYLNCSTDVDELVVKTSEKQSLLENLGKFIRYKGSSTRGNFMNTLELNYADSASPWCFKFSDDSCDDEDYIPDTNKNGLSNEDSDWSPAVKCLKRKNTKNCPTNAKVRNGKSNKVDQVLRKLNYSSVDSLRTPADNSFCATLTERNCNVNPTLTSFCFSTNLTQVSKKNRSQISSMRPHSKITQSRSSFEVKRKHSNSHVSQTRPSENSIELIDISSDSDLEGKSKALTSDCRSSDLIERMSKNKHFQITPIKLEPKMPKLEPNMPKLEPNMPTLNTVESRPILKTQRKRTKSQAFRKNSFSLNDSKRVMNGSAERSEKDALKKHEYYMKSTVNVGNSKQQVSKNVGKRSLQIVPINNDSQLITKSIDAISIDTKSPSNTNNVQRKHSEDEVSQISNSAVNTDIRVISKNNSSQIMLKGDSKCATLNASKFQTIRNIQKTLQSILKQSNQPKRQVSKASNFSSNCSTDSSGSNDSQTVSKKQDSQLVTEVQSEKLTNISIDEISQSSNCALNDNGLETNSSEIELMKHNSKLMPGLFFHETQSNKKIEQPKEPVTIAGYSVKNQELNKEVPIEGQSYLLNTLSNRSEQKVEHSSILLTSHIFDECFAHCDTFSCNLNKENISSQVPGCNYCKNFAELDAIATLAAADLGENPKAYIDHQIESTEAMYDKLKVEQPHDNEVDLKLTKIALKNRGLKYGRDFLSSFGSFINVSEHFLKSNEVETN